MSDWYLFGAPLPGRRRRGESRNGSAANNPVPGAVAGSDAGRVRVPRVGHREQSRPRPANEVVIGPGGVTESLPLDREAEDRLDRLGTMAAVWGEEAGQLARRSRYRPVWPNADEPSEAPSFPIGPGGILRPAPLTHRTARATGVPEAFLDRLITQESGGRADARAETSSATGTTQFIDDTWLGMISRHGARYGHPDLAAAVKKRGNRYYVDDERVRRDILDLRLNPEWSAIMGAEHARENAIELGRRLRRDPLHREVYLAHFLGVENATAMIRAADSDRLRVSGRATSAADIVGQQAAQANASIFFSGARARSAAEVIELQGRKFGRETFRLSGN